MLTNNAFADAGQDLQGYWYYGNVNDRDIFRLTAPGGPWILFHYGDNPRVFENIRTGERDPINANFAGVWGQFQMHGTCVNGLSTSIEKRIAGVPPRCPQWLWWDQSQACFAPNGLRDGKLVVHGFKHETQGCVQNENQPDNREAALTRFIGASFAPVAPGQYIHITAVAAPQGYRAIARVVWDYREIQRVLGRPMSVRIAGGQGAPVTIASPLPVYGSQDIRSELPGRMKLTVSARNEQGRDVHTDQLVVDFPRIPGL